MSAQRIYNNTGLTQVVKRGLAGFLCLGVLMAPLGVAEDSPESGVLLTNRAEKHAENPEARIHPSEPDPTWRQPRPSPPFHFTSPTTGAAQGTTAAPTGVYPPAIPVLPNRTTRPPESPERSDRPTNRGSRSETESNRKQTPPPPVATQGPASEQTTGRGNSSSIRPDGLGGYRVRAQDGSTRTVRPDGLGGYRTRSDSGTGSIRPDGMGGYRIREADSTTSTMRPDGLGGYRIREADGSTTKMRPDGMGGYRIHEADGSISRVRPDGMGGFRRH